jgi:hypothetical protein
MVTRKNKRVTVQRVGAVKVLFKQAKERTVEVKR